MPKITPIHYKKLVKFFEKNNFVFNRQKGDHLVYIRADIERPIIIPAYPEVPVFIIMNNLKTSGISREEYLEFLKRK